MKFKKIKNFNLIEVTLAIGILAIGATAVLALFPLGIDRNKSSIGENYCADAAGDIVSYIEGVAINDWNNISVIPTVKKDIKSSSRYENDFTFGALLGGAIYKVTDADSESSPMSTDGNDGIYGIKFSSDPTASASSVVDFMGEIQLWRTDANSEITTGLYLEISWPVTMRYDLRNKNYYYIEIFNYDY
jgi:hypothetical protein